VVESSTVCGLICYCWYVLF